MASRSLVQLFRQINPDLLHKRDRGRPTEATLAVKAREFGELDVKEFIPGAEVIENSEEGEIENEEISDCEDSDSENKKEDTVLSQDEKVARAKEVTLGKILTDEDFRRIEAA